MLNSKKGGFGAAILIAVIAVAVVFGSVLYFFFVFKAHATLEAREEYIWNKVQEVPLDLFSMDVDGESFVSRINKVYYDFEDETKLTDKTRDIIYKQVFYFIEGTQYPFEAVINIAGVKITYYLEGCDFDLIARTMGVCDWQCNVNCGDNAGKFVSGLCSDRENNLKECFFKTDTKIHYSAKYPFPLAFNGTDELVSELSYDAIEEK